MLTGVRLVGAADKARLRGVVPGELGLGWGTGGCKRCGLGGGAEAGEQAAGGGGIGDEGYDGAATAAGALENVLGEHPAREPGPGPAWLALVGRALHPPDDASVFLEGSAPPVPYGPAFPGRTMGDTLGESWTVTWRRAAG